jgi:O-antigen/teichoic acid export membrane protein
MAADSHARTFSGRVVVLFATQAIATGVGVVNGFLLARLLGPAGKGDYYLLVLLPATAMILIQLGLPQAFGFYAARGQTVGVVAKTLILTAALSLLAAVGVLVLLPFLRETFLRGIGLGQIDLAFIALPLALNAAFTTNVVVGRQAVRWYAAVNVTYPIATTILLVVIVGRLGLGVTGALVVYLIAWGIQTGGFLMGARRVVAAVDRALPVCYRELFGYGLPFYPGSITQYFNYRADVYLLAWLLATPAAPIGYYSVAVALAEMLFLLPNSVSLLFFPQVAGSSREASDRQVPTVSRVTLLITAAFAVLLLPAAVLVIGLFLPAFVPSLAPLFVLLPGVVALSAAKVLGGYVSGLGLTSLTSYVNVSAFILNVVVNIVLIPRFGIVGAAAASLVSYSASSVAFTVIAARLSHSPPLDFWIPRADDVRFTLASAVSIGRRLRRTVGGA